MKASSKLIAQVCVGELGAVFGLEVSRLARSNADLAWLLELVGLAGALVIDDGVYDLSDINDWLLLGLKSQMSGAALADQSAERVQVRRSPPRRAARPAAGQAHPRRCERYLR